MKLYVLDTDTISLHQRGHAKIDRKIFVHQLHDDVTTTIITVREQWNGWLSQLNRVKSPDLLAEVYGQMTAMMNYFHLFRLLTFDESSIYRYDTLKKMKLGVGAADLRIAAIALELGGTVVTRNRVDFQRVPGLPIEDWSR